MKWKEAFEAYQQGNASEKEAMYVEEHLEQFQDLMDLSVEKETQKQENVEDVYPIIKQKIKQRRWKRIILIILIPLLLMGGYRFWQCATTFPLSKKDPDTNVNLYGAIRSLSSELYDPEHIYSSTYVETTGFGKYELQYYNHKKVTYETSTGGSIADHYTGTFYKKTFLGSGALYEINGQENAMFEGQNPYFNMTVNQNKIELSQIEQAPAQMKFSIYLKLKETMTLEELLTWQKENEAQDIQMGLSWIPIVYGETSNETGDHPYYFGMDLFQERLIEAYDTITSKKYPYLMLNELDSDGQQYAFLDADATQYETHIQSVLNYLIDHEETIEQHHWDVDELKEMKNFIETEGISTDMVYLVIEQEDLMRLLQQDRFLSGHITNTALVYF